MALSVTELQRLRLMVNEPDPAGDYDDTLLNTLADAVARVPDSAGLAPSATGYVDTYDLYGLAAEIWRLKASAAAAEFDFEAEGGVFYRSQVVAQYTKQATRYADMSRFRSTTTY